MKKTELIFCGVISALAFYLFNRIAAVFLLQTGNYFERINAALDTIVPAITSRVVYLDMSKEALTAGLIGVIAVWLIYLYNAFQPKKYMPGKEHGSAEWGTADDIVPYKDKDPENNILLTATEQLSMSDRMKRTKDDDFNRNKNILVIGGSGSGKTRFFVKPNLMQLHSSYVITDPKGLTL